MVSCVRIFVMETINNQTLELQNEIVFIHIRNDSTY